jgi:hypothetical protein
MTPREQLEWEHSLKVGDAVEIRWTNNFRFYREAAHVSKINAKTIRATLDHEVRGPSLTGRQEETTLYEASREIIAPRYLTTGQTANNGVFPRDRP